MRTFQQETVPVIMVELAAVDVFRAQLAEYLESRSEEMVDAISSAMFADLGPYQQLAGPGEVDRLRANIREVIAAFRRMVTGKEAFNVDGLTALHMTGSRRAQQGIPQDAVTESVEIAMRVTWRFVRDGAQLLTRRSRTSRPEVNEAATAIADLAIETRDFLNELTAAIVTGYRMEREHGDSGRAHATADLVDEILDARWGNVRRLRQAGRSLGYDVAEPLVVALLAPPDSIADFDPVAVTTEVTTVLPSALPSRLRRTPVPHIAVVVPYGEGVDPQWVRTSLAASPIADTALVFVDDAGRGLTAVPAAYRMLASEFAAARVAANGAGVVSPRDTDLLRLLRSLPLSARLDFVRRVLGPVLDLAPGKAEDALRTLHAHFHGRAADLHLHRNSFRYRVDRAQSLLGLNFRETSDRLKVQVALTLHELSRQEAASLDGHEDGPGRSA